MNLNVVILWIVNFGFSIFCKRKIVIFWGVILFNKYILNMEDIVLLKVVLIGIRYFFFIKGGLLKVYLIVSGILEYLK